MSKRITNRKSVRPAFAETASCRQAQQAIIVVPDVRDLVQNTPALSNFAKATLDKEASEYKKKARLNSQALSLKKNVITRT